MGKNDIYLDISMWLCGEPSHQRDIHLTSHNWIHRTSVYFLFITNKRFFPFHSTFSLDHTLSISAPGSFQVTHKSAGLSESEHHGAFGGNRWTNKCRRVILLPLSGFSQHFICRRKSTAAPTSSSSALFSISSIYISCGSAYKRLRMWWVDELKKKSCCMTVDRDTWSIKVYLWCVCHSAAFLWW